MRFTGCQWIKMQWQGSFHWRTSPLSAWGCFRVKIPFHPKSPFCASLSESFVVSTVIENSLHITANSPDNLYPCLCRNIQALLELLHVHQVLWDGIIIIIVPAHRVKNWPDWVNISEYCHKFLQGGPPLTPVTTRAPPHMLCTQYQRTGSNVPVLVHFLVLLYFRVCWIIWCFVLFEAG